ncbi:MAG: hypothetical protein E6R04_00045 [Spirochaetes bacterium]|nr:MAG: hypothetical protein E6R04_00045 [Spirochaetota bacterium]
MLDVIHVFFEEDMMPTWEQSTEAKSALRKAMYTEMYGVEYKYGYTSEQGRSSDWNGSVGPNLYDAPPDGSIKPYIPPSSPEELSAILGTPMGE